MSGLRLGCLTRDKRDFFVVPRHRSRPNFVTAWRIEVAPLRLAPGPMDMLTWRPLQKWGWLK